MGWLRRFPRWPPWMGPLYGAACQGCGAPILFGTGDGVPPDPVLCPGCANGRIKVIGLSAALRLLMLISRMEEHGVAASYRTELKELADELSDIHLGE